MGSSPAGMSRRFIRGRVDGAYLIVYDRVRGVVVEEITDYGLYLYDFRELSALTVDQVTSNLVCFWKYLCSQGREIAQITDSVLKGFRETEFKLVMSAKSGKGKKRKAQVTVNQKLRDVYVWLWWLRERRSEWLHLIGPQDCTVRSVSKLIEGNRNDSPSAEQIGRAHV